MTIVSAPKPANAAYHSTIANKPVTAEGSLWSAHTFIPHAMYNIANSKVRHLTVLHSVLSLSLSLCVCVCVCVCVFSLSL